MIDKNYINRYIHQTIYIISLPFIYIFLIYYFYVISKITVCYLYTKFSFLKWAKRQKLVLISGGPKSGKKLLLNFLSKNLKSPENNVLNYLGLFDSNKAYDLSEKEWKSFSEIFSYDDERNVFLINEIEDVGVWSSKTSKSETERKKSIILKICNGNYFNNIFWIAFSARNGLLWNKLYSRALVSIECISAKVISFLFFRFHLLEIVIKENSSKFKKYTIIFREKAPLGYDENWNTRLLLNSENFLKGK